MMTQEGREVRAACLLLFGDQAELELEDAEDPGATARWPAAAIAADTGLQPAELPGARFLVHVTQGDDGPVFSRFRIAR